MTEAGSPLCGRYFFALLGNAVGYDRAREALAPKRKKTF